MLGKLIDGLRRSAYAAHLKVSPRLFTKEVRARRSEVELAKLSVLYQLAPARIAVLLKTKSAVFPWLRIEALFRFILSAMEANHCFDYTIFSAGICDYADTSGKSANRSPSRPNKTSAHRIGR